MKIYISGKITGLDYNEAFAMFEAAEDVLKRLGHVPVNPMKKVSEQEGKSWAEYMKEDIPILLECDGIYLLPNWRESRGARLERNIARELDMTAMYAIFDLCNAEASRAPEVKCQQPMGHAGPCQILVV
jgi:hypothetical protein